MKRNNISNIKDTGKKALGRDIKHNENKQQSLLIKLNIINKQLEEDREKLRRRNIKLHEKYIKRNKKI